MLWSYNVWKIKFDRKKTNFDWKRSCLDDWSSENDCCLWLTFRQHVREPSSESSKQNKQTWRENRPLKIGNFIKNFWLFIAFSVNHWLCEGECSREATHFLLFFNRRSHSRRLEASTGIQFPFLPSYDTALQDARVAPEGNTPSTSNTGIDSGVIWTNRGLRTCPARIQTEMTPPLDPTTNHSGVNTRGSDGVVMDIESLTANQVMERQRDV